MDSAATRTVPAPRKDLSKIGKRKRSNTKPMDIESLIATLADDSALMETPVEPQRTQINYYTYPEQQIPPPPPPPPKPVWEPRLLIRQAYKVADEACIVVGLECVRDYKPSIYIVSNHSTVSLTFEDLISLCSPSIVATIDRHLSEASYFKALYLNTVVIEASGGDSITISNYHVKGNISSCWNRQVRSGIRSESDVIKDTCGVVLHAHGWSSFKKHFDCIESYYSICNDCSTEVQLLMVKYSRFLTKHYRAEAFLSGNIVATQDGGDCTTPINLDQDLVRRITADVPVFLQELNEKRLPAVDPTQERYYQPTAVQLALLPWLDSEVRRYCAPNLIETVMDNLKYYYIW